jgi:Ca2+-binding RTX toxin-like protein
MNRSTVSNNDGANASTGNGDGIYNVGNATLTNVTVSGNGQNTAKGQGGGIYNTGSLTLLNSTIAMNEASFQSGDGGNIYNTGSVTAHDTIIADALTSGDCGGSLFTSTGNNLKDADTTACFVSPQPSDLIADPQIGPLQNNGGPTKTHAIPASSPAKDAGATCSTIDQRGVSRPQGPVCDIGAYEFALCGTVVVNIVGTSGNDTLNGTSVGDGILGLNGNDTINGNGGNDAICPGAGIDTANGGPGNDTFFLKDGVADSADGGTGTDTATIDNGIDSTTNMEVIH